jgi:single-strand DNA-binding protein
MYSKTVIIGNLGDDPKLKYTAQGQPVAEFSVAVNRKGKDGENVVTWYAVTAWAKLGETCAKHLTRGRLVLVEGEVKASAWNDHDGKARAKLELTARDVRFLGGKDQAEQMALGGVEVGGEEGDLPF